MDRYGVNASGDALLQQAMRENPDPSCLVPVKAVGLDALSVRSKEQTHQQALYQQKYNEITQQITELNRLHNTVTLVKLREAARKQRQLVHLTLKCMALVQMLRGVGYSLFRDEEEMAARFAALSRDLERPAEIRGRLAEVWASLMQAVDSGALGQAGVDVAGTDEALKATVKV